MSPPIVLFDYAISPYGQKVRQALSLAKLPFRQCDQPMVLPRPDFVERDITHRRIPLLAIGKDIYCDSSCILDALEGLTSQPISNQADKAYEAFGNTLIAALTRSFPIELMAPLVKDRQTIFPSLSRPDYSTLRPSALSDFKASLDIIEKQFLAGKPFISGTEPSFSDAHLSFVVKWALKDLGFSQIDGFSEKDIPNLYAWIDRLPLPPIDAISAAEAFALLSESDYHVPDLKLSEPDPLGLALGTEVCVETADSTPGSHPQFGVLCGSTTTEVVVEIPSGFRLHFPKRGYIIREKKTFLKL